MHRKYFTNEKEEEKSINKLKEEKTIFSMDFLIFISD